jgi:hypothetical protein
MTKGFIIAMSVILLALAGAWAIAQPTPTIQAQPEPAPERLAVSAAGNTAVLLDATTGKTWVLHQPADAGVAWVPVWVPVRRFDSEDEYQTWCEQERMRRQDVELKKRLTPEAFERLKKTREN